MRALHTTLRALLPVNEQCPRDPTLDLTDKRHRTALALLLLAFVAYLSVWVAHNWDWIANPLSQNDDVRIQIMPMHRFGPERALMNDPVALDHLASVPPGLIAIYAVLVKASSVNVAPKIVQIMCLLMIAGAGILTYRRRGLVAAVILVFLFLRADPVLNRIAGGLPRSFGFPLLALWLAGALTQHGWARAAAAWLGALFYPTVTALILGAEGVLLLADASKRSWSDFLAGLRRLFFLAGTCVVMIVPHAIQQRSVDGPIVTYAEAEQNPAFLAGGRLHFSEGLPFRAPGAAISEALTAAVGARGPALLEPAARYVRSQPQTAGFIVLIIFATLAFAGAARAPRESYALLAASLVLYSAARGIAYLLYVPERYLFFGLTVAAIAFVIGIVTSVDLRQGSRHQPLVAVGLTIVLIMGTWTLMGFGHRRNSGSSTIGGRGHETYQFIKKLPTSIRIAAHPSDGDNIPFWTGRPTVSGWETGVPWFTGMWARYDKRTRDTLDALYTTSRDALFAYTHSYRVTHLWLDDRRYGEDFVARAKFFEPYATYLDERLNGISHVDLVLRTIPDDAIVHRNETRILVEVEKLKRAWKWGSANSGG